MLLWPFDYLGIAAVVLPVVIAAVSSPSTPASPPACSASEQALLELHPEEAKSEASTDIGDPEEPKSRAIPDVVGNLDLTTVPMHERAMLVIKEVKRLAARPEPKTLQTRTKHMDLLWEYLAELTEEECATLGWGAPAPAAPPPPPPSSAMHPASSAIQEITELLSDEDTVLPELAQVHQDAARVAQITVRGPMSYLDALESFPPEVSEIEMLRGDYGTYSEVLTFAQSVLSPRAVAAFFEPFHIRMK